MVKLQIKDDKVSWRDYWRSAKAHISRGRRLAISSLVSSTRMSRSVGRGMEQLGT